MSVPYPPVNGTEPCRQNPDAWHPTNGHPNNVTAKKLCRGCHIVTECLAYALDNDVLGIWGGTGVGERRGMRKRPISRSTGDLAARREEVLLLKAAGLSLKETADRMGLHERQVSRARAWGREDKTA